MAYQTSNSVASGSPTTLFDKDVDGVGPIEWEINTDQDIEVVFTGVFLGGAATVLYYAGETKTIGSPTRGITKITAEATGTTATVKLRPTIA